MNDAQTDAGWVLLGELTRARRERLGLKQADLSHYGGPGGTTVGKVERAEQRNFPPRTRQQLEKALGWKRGTVEQILDAATAAWRHDAGMWDDFRDGLVEDNLPDLTIADPAPTVATLSARDLTDEELLAELTYRMRRYADTNQEAHRGNSPASTRAGGSPALTISDEAQHLPIAELHAGASQPPAGDTPG